MTTLRGEIRGNDTVMEHFPQLALLLTTIFAGKTRTQLDVGLSLPARIFIDENSYFLWASALISLLSIWEAMIQCSSFGLKNRLRFHFDSETCLN